MSFDDWYYSTDCGNEMGIWKGYDELNKNDFEHFDIFHPKT